MEDNGLRTIFGLSISAVYIRLAVLNKKGFRNKMCMAMAAGFNLGQDAGDDFYNYLQEDSDIENTVGFSQTSTYKNYESSMAYIINNYLPDNTENERELLNIAAHAIIFGYCMIGAGGVKISTLSKVIGQVLNNIGSIVFENSPFETTRTGEVIHPFSISAVESLLSNDYSSTIAYIATSDRNKESEVSNYNWYDTSKIFHQPNLQILKDIENQYYYVSGELLYDAIGDDVSDCVEDNVNIIGANGQPISFTYLRTVPCRDPKSYIGPVPNIKFHRIFNDGPPSSGDFNSDVKNAYIHFDKSGMPVSDWHHNRRTLYSYEVDNNGNNVKVTSSSVRTDSPGRIGLYQEYAKSPASMDCTNVAQSMHIGFTGSVIKCSDEVKCVTCASSNFTGWKFSPLFVSEEGLNKEDYQYFLANPVCNTGNISKRMLTIDSHNPIHNGTLVGDDLQTWNESFGKQYWYFGPPQPSEFSSLPALAFFQTFDNQTFGSRAKIVLFPSQTSSKGASYSSESSRSNSVSSFPIATGEDNNTYGYSENGARAKFYTKIGSAELNNRDEITKQFFSMGDFFEGKYSLVSKVLKNSHFEYTGYLLSGGGQIIELNNIIDSYQEDIIGDDVKTITFISGYLVNGQTVGLVKKIAFDESGIQREYYYLDNSFPETSNIKYTGWSSFSPLPEDMENEFPRIMATQSSDNYLPRFTSGPFNTENRKFLYPQALGANALYVGKLRGFPYKVKFNLEVREEVVKEIFGVYHINSDGTVSSNIKYIPVKRPDGLGGLAYPNNAPIMTKIFETNDVGWSSLDINNKKVDQPFQKRLGINLVNNQWAPLYKGFVPSGKNNTTFNLDADINTYFENGYYLTGYDVWTHKWFTGLDSEHYIYTYDLRPLSLGLFHAYDAFTDEVELIYTPPIFNINSGRLGMTPGINSTFADYYSQTCQITDNNDQRFDIETGKDPLFFEYIGGRQEELLNYGLYSASGQGGYHSREIIGDAWLGFSAQTYSIYCRDRSDDYPCYDYQCFRTPEDDDGILLFNSSPTGTVIWASSLRYNPLGYTGSLPLPFTSSSVIQYAKIGYTGNLITTFRSGMYLEFDLSTLFPIINKTSSIGEWYDSSGITIGPFDRDVEIGLMYPNSVQGFTDLYVNNRKVSQMYADNPNCTDDPTKESQYIISGLKLEEGGRYANYSIVSVIKAGYPLHINVYSNPTVGGDGYIEDGHLAETKKGVPSGKLTLKARKTLNGENYHLNFHKGERDWLNIHNFPNNGLELKFVIPHSNGFEGLKGSHTFVTFSRTGKLYPQPDDESRFTGYGRIDSFDNFIYDSSDTVEEYWSKRCRQRRQGMDISGYREGVRISFTFKNVSIEYKAIPYEDLHIINPSGYCVVSGEMGYLGQADTAIFTEGIILENISSGDELKPLYDPVYMSPVLSRLNPKFFIEPTSTTNRPVLEAPSIMKQRKPGLRITDYQEYSGMFMTYPENYNKLLWPAFSSIEILNPGETIEIMPPDDGLTFTNSAMIFSASRGQPLPNGLKNPDISKQYGISNQFQMYDSVSTDAIINSGKCITSGRGTRVTLQEDLLNSAFATEGLPICLVSKNLI